MKKIISLLIFLGVLYSCDNGNSSEQTPVARVYNKYLYQSELAEVIPNGLSKADSVKAAAKYIDDWVKEQTVVYNAEYNLPEEKQDFQKQLTNYKNSLLKYAYETELLKLRLDTSVSYEEVEAYYTRNIESFKLKEYAVRASFIKVSKDLNNLSLAESLFRSSRPEDQLDLEDFCTQYATKYFFDRGDDWMYLSQLLKEVPLEVGAYPDRFFRYNRIKKMVDENYIYLVHVHEYLKEGETAPLSIEQERIKNSILNKRKMDVLNKIRYDLYAKANNNKEIEIY